MAATYNDTAEENEDAMKKQIMLPSTCIKDGTYKDSKTSSLSTENH